MTPSPSTESDRPEVGPPPSFDPEFAPVLAQLAKMPALTADLVPVVRAKRPVPPTLDELARDGDFAVEERQVPGPEGAPDVTVLVCRPTAARQLTPAIYYVHGGAFVLGDARSDLGWVLDAAEELQLTVLSVEYRLAPETQHPGPLEDCHAGLVWAVEHAVELGIDAARMVLAGGSAGGALAAGVALVTRDDGGPHLAGLLLDSPALDDRMATVSSHQMVGSPFDRTALDTAWTALLGGARGGGEVSPYASPARATDLSALPPTFIDVGSAESLRDECVAFATRMWQAGGDAELHVWPGAFHAYDLVAPQAGLSRLAVSARVQWLRRQLVR